MVSVSRAIKMTRLGTREKLEARLAALGVSLPIDDAVDSDGALSEPFEIAGRRVANRFSVLPMEGWDGTGDGRPTDGGERRSRRRQADDDEGGDEGGTAIVVCPLSDSGGEDGDGDGGAAAAAALLVDREAEAEAGAVVRMEVLHAEPTVRRAHHAIPTRRS